MEAQITDSIPTYCEYVRSPGIPQEGQARTAKKAGSITALRAGALSIRMISPARKVGKCSSVTTFNAVGSGFRSILGKAGAGLFWRLFLLSDCRFRTLIILSQPRSAPICWRYGARNTPRVMHYKFFFIERACLSFLFLAGVELSQGGSHPARLALPFQFGTERKVWFRLKWQTGSGIHKFGIISNLCSTIGALSPALEGKDNINREVCAGRMDTGLDEISGVENRIFGYQRGSILCHAGHPALCPHRTQLIGNASRTLKVLPILEPDHPLGA